MLQNTIHVIIARVESNVDGVFGTTAVAAFRLALAGGGCITYLDSHMLGKLIVMSYSVHIILIRQLTRDRF